jgi:hypothetical protein
MLGCRKFWLTNVGNVHPPKRAIAGDQPASGLGLQSAYMAPLTPLPGVQEQDPMLQQRELVLPQAKYSPTGWFASWPFKQLPSVWQSPQHTVARPSFVTSQLVTEAHG